MKSILLVEPFEQAESMCGPASLKMILDYYGVKKPEKELAKMCKTTRKLGTSGENLKKAAKKLGFKVKIKDNSSFEDIKHWISKKVPVIVDWFTRGIANCDDSDVACGHYSVAVGLDNKFIYLQDPELGKIRKIKREDFMTVWFDFKGEHIKPNKLVVRRIIAVYK